MSRMCHQIPTFHPWKTVRRSPHLLVGELLLPRSPLPGLHLSQQVLPHHGNSNMSLGDRVFFPLHRLRLLQSLLVFVLPSDFSRQAGLLLGIFEVGGLCPAFVELLLRLSSGGDGRDFPRWSWRSRGGFLRYRADG